MEGYPERIDSKFRYVLLAAHRAEQLMKGATPKDEKPGKPTTLGMKEIREDRVEWEYGLPPEPEPTEEEGEGEEAEAAAEADDEG